MDKIIELANSSVEMAKAMKDAGEQSAAKKKEKAEEKICQLISQLPRLRSRLGETKCAATCHEGAVRPLARWLSPWPRSAFMIKKGEPVGWPVAEMTVVVRLRWWRRMARKFKIGWGRQNSPVVMGAQGVLLRDAGSGQDVSLCEYFRREPQDWIIIGEDYNPDIFKLSEPRNILPKFAIPSSYSRLLSGFPTQKIVAQTWAACLEAGMFELAKKAAEAQAALDGQVPPEPPAGPEPPAVPEPPAATLAETATPQEPPAAPEHGTQEELWTSCCQALSPNGCRQAA